MHTEVIKTALTDFFSVSYFLLSHLIQARNIAVCVEFRESDEEDAQALKVYVYYRYTVYPDHVLLIPLSPVFLLFLFAEIGVKMVQKKEYISNALCISAE